MFQIEDCPNGLYQWDLNRKIRVNDKTITEVHFCNLISEDALVVKVIDGYAAIPNILLQESDRLRVYAFNGENVRFDAFYDIKPRVKPQSYVYTETEIKTWEKLEEQIKEAGSGSGSGSPGGYYTPSVDETGVLSWAPSLPSMPQVPGTNIKGEKGDAGAPGQQGAKGDKGEPGVPGDKGERGEKGDKGEPGEKGAAFTFADFTEEQLLSLKGEPGQKGDKGDKGDQGIPGETPDMSLYQPKLIAGENITIENNVISASGSSSGGSGSGNVSVDGTTIIKNSNGAISTAIGGSKTITSPEEIKANVSGLSSLGSLTSNRAYTVADLAITPSLFGEDSLVMKITGSKSGEAFEVQGGLTPDYSEGFGVALFTATGDLANYIKQIKTDTGKITIGSVSGFYLSTVKIFKPEVVTYTQIDGHFIKVDSSLTVNTKNELSLSAGLCGDSSIGTIYMIGNTVSVNAGKSAAFGYSNNVSEKQSIALGANNYIQPYNTGSVNAITIGSENNINGNNIIGIGCGLYGSTSYSTVMGKYNLYTQGNSLTQYNNTYLFTIGNGSSSSNRSNGFTLDDSGNGTFAGRVNSSGSDYAEYFEWADGNPDNEDRVGYLVALDKDKIRIANSNDDIFGIISGTVAMLGDNFEWQWQGKYLTDDFGRILYDIVDEQNEAGEVIAKTPVPRLNPAWNENETYIPRSKRKEWAPVGLLGKLYVRDDGTCQPNDYITVGNNGVATVSPSKTNIRVMSRKTDNIIRVFVK